MNASDAEKKVKERWPDAIAFKWTGYWRIYLNGLTKDSEPEAFGTEAAAWLDAAQRMEAENGA